jgi:uncharacterized protein YjbJ (UPF0337 family)
MQYVQRKLQRSVTEIRRSLSGRPNVSCASTRETVATDSDHEPKGVDMDDDRIEGKLKEAEGKLTGDKGKEAEGEAQGALGKAKDAADDASDAVRDKVDDLKN